MSRRKIIFNATSLKYRRQELRRRSTLAEKILWREVRDRKLGYKFIRQYSIEGYVMDFYCPEKRVGIELEGSIHNRPSTKTYDKYRKRYLEAYNIRLLRFNNVDVLSDIGNVLAQIDISLS